MKQYETMDFRLGDHPLYWESMIWLNVVIYHWVLSDFHMKWSCGAGQIYVYLRPSAVHHHYPFVQETYNCALAVLGRPSTMAIKYEF